MQSLISIGSNIGNSILFIKKSINIISNNNKILLSSKIMKTSPLGVLDQNYFYNQLILIDTTLNAFALLDYLKNIELKLGRQNRAKWREREIDLDILTYEKLVICTDKLIIPHKELTNRLFILIAAKSMIPDFIVPNYNKSFLKLYDTYKHKLKDQFVELIN